MGVVEITTSSIQSVRAASAFRDPSLLSIAQGDARVLHRNDPAGPRRNCGPDQPFIKIKACLPGCRRRPVTHQGAVYGRYECQGKDDDFIGPFRAARVVRVDAGLGICNSSDCSLFGSEGGRMAEAQTHVFRVSLSPKIYRDFEILSAKNLCDLAGEIVRLRF